MWIVLSVQAAFFSGISMILQKNGTKGEKLLQTSALNNTAILIVALVAVLASGSYVELAEMPARSWGLVVTSGFTQAASWVTFFAGLKYADVNVYMALDKVNIIVTMLLAWLLLGDVITLPMLKGTVLIVIGTVAMTEIQNRGIGSNREGRYWLFFGIVSPALQAITNILAKLDTAPISTDLTTAIRVLIVVLVLWILSLVKYGLPSRGFVQESGGIWLLSGGAMIGISYLFMYRAISLGNAAVVTTIVKASFLISIALACSFLHERLSRRGWIGFAAVCLGTGLFAI